MPNPTTPAPNEIQAIAAQLPDASKGTYDSLDVKQGEGMSEKIVDAIEMIGEETAAGFHPAPSQVSPGMRYLHASRTIHQLVTDRNRAVGIYLAVASLLVTASGAILHANPPEPLTVPMHEIQRWCLPLTFAVLTVLAGFMAMLLIRTRVGLIYEVAKMNALLGLPIGRVQRIGPLSIHFVLQVLISVGGGLSAALFMVFVLRPSYADAPMTAVLIGVLVGILITAILITSYILTVIYTTADHRLQKLEETPPTK